MKLKFFRLLLFFIFCALHLNAQHYNFKKYSTKNGLAHSTVLQIIQDNSGIIWLATEGGLNRFDGKKIKSYHKSDGLLTSTITCLLEDKNHNIWIGTAEGVNKYDGVKFTSYKNFGLNHIIYSIYQDASNIIWFCTDGGGLVSYDGKSFKQFTKENGLPIDSIFCITQDKEKNYWVGTRHGGVCKIKPEGFASGKLNCEILTTKDGLTSNNVFCIMQDSKNTIWLGTTSGGVCTYKDGELKAFFISTETNTDYVPKIIEDKRGNIWIGTFEHGLVKYSKNTLTFFSEKEGLQSHTINSLFEDNESNIWIGTDQGVAVFRNDAFLNFVETDGLPARQVYSFAEINNTLILCGTASGLSYFDGKKINGVPEIPELKNAPITSIEVDDEGKIWIGTYDGILVLSKKEKFQLEKRITEIDGIPLNLITNIMRSQSGEMWVASYGNGLFKFVKNKVTHFSAQEGLLNTNIYSLFEDSKKKLWVGTFQGGVYAFDGIQFVNFTKKDGLSDNTIWGIAQNKKGDLFFSTDEGGLSVYDGKKFHTIDETNGLSSNQLNSVITDNNILWLASNKGLNRVVLTDYYDIDTYKLFTDQNGLEGNEMVSSNSLFKDSKGMLWIGTTDGLSRFNPASDFANPTPPILVLQSIRLFYQNVNWKKYSELVDFKSGLPEKLILDYKNNHLTFNFQAITTDNNVKYRYMLEGLEKSWSPSTTSTEAIYANIPSGREYIFKVQAVNSDGVWSTTNIEFKFTIQSPIYQRWWFIALSILLLVSGIILFINYRTRRLAQEKKILEDKVEERTEELQETNSKLNVAFKDIKDSINYAQRIQQAILPVEAKIKDVLNDSFILFKPRDVVSGDFYWFGSVEKNNETHHIIAAADCTGHGVPGAFMSMIGNTILNEIVITKEIINPSEILSQLCSGVRKALKQNQNTSRDGMDICLCCINTKTNDVTYAGAFNPLWILRNDKTVEVIKATKSAIGGFTADNQIFESHKVKLQKGESIYLFTDGYADQFGGESGKKLTTKKFRDTIVELKDKTMSEQGFYLNNFIEIWRDQEFQVDDILVIGVRL